MNEMPLHDHHQGWTDGHIAVRFVGFNPSSGDAHFQVTEQHERVGVYYIWVVYGPDSGPPLGPASQSAICLYLRRSAAETVGSYERHPNSNWAAERYDMWHKVKRVGDNL